LLLQSLIVLTGNYNFFNLLTMLLCIFLFDDAKLWRPRSSGVAWDRGRKAVRRSRVARTVIAHGGRVIVVRSGFNRIGRR